MVGTSERIDELEVVISKLIPGLDARVAALEVEEGVKEDLLRKAQNTICQNTTMLKDKNEIIRVLSSIIQEKDTRINEVEAELDLIRVTLDRELTEWSKLCTEKNATIEKMDDRLEAQGVNIKEYQDRILKIEGTWADDNSRNLTRILELEGQIEERNHAIYKLNCVTSDLRDALGDRSNDIEECQDRILEIEGTWADDNARNMARIKELEGQIEDRIPEIEGTWAGDTEFKHRIPAHQIIECHPTHHQFFIDLITGGTPYVYEGKQWRVTMVDTKKNCCGLTEMRPGT